MEKLRIELDLLTPMYMAGASASPEFRAPSVKGLLRFWYRAIDPHYKNREPFYFGDARKKEVSSFVLRTESNALNFCYLLKPPRMKTKVRPCAQIKRGSGLSYLAYPFGLSSGERLAISPNQNLIVDHTILPNASIPDDAPELSKVLVSSWWALGTIGGLGARSRRCFGSVQVKSLETDWYEKDIITLLSKAKSPDKWWEGFKIGLVTIRKWFGEGHKDDHLALSPGTRFTLLGIHKDEIAGFPTWSEAMDEFGALMQSFRSNKPPSGGKSLTPEQRAGFGLPISGYDPKLRRTVLEINGEKHDRSASPILGSVVRIGNEYYVLVTLTQSPVLAPGERIRIKEEGKDARTASVFSNKVEEFYNSLVKETRWSVKT